MSIREVFRRCIEAADLTGPERLVGDLVVSDSFTRAEFEKLVAVKGLAGSAEFKLVLLDLLLLFANECVDDHALSPTEIEELSFLASVFRIDEGDFFKARQEEVRELLVAQLAWILRDGYVNEQEEVLQRELQKLLGLSYDQFVILLQPQVKTYLEALTKRKTQTLDREELTQIERSIRNLRSVFLIADSDRVGIDADVGKRR